MTHAELKCWDAKVKLKLFQTLSQSLLQGRIQRGIFKTIFRLLLCYKNVITILYSCECRNTYFKTKKSGENDEQNKINEVRIKRAYVGYMQA